MHQELFVCGGICDRVTMVNVGGSADELLFYY
jgi:hypothetical protein